MANINYKFCLSGLLSIILIGIIITMHSLLDIDQLKADRTYYINLSDIQEDNIIDKSLYIDETSTKEEIISEKHIALPNQKTNDNTTDHHTLHDTFIKAKKNIFNKVDNNINHIVDDLKNAANKIKNLITKDQTTPLLKNENNNKKDNTINKNYDVTKNDNASNNNINLANFTDQKDINKNLYNISALFSENNSVRLNTNQNILIVVDLGLENHIIKAAIDLPDFIYMGISPYLLFNDKEISKLLQNYKNRVMIEIPLDSHSSLKDDGPLTISKNKSLYNNINNLKKIINTSTEYMGYYFDYYSEADSMSLHALDYLNKEENKLVLLLDNDGVFEKMHQHQREEIDKASDHKTYKNFIIHDLELSDKVIYSDIIIDGLKYDIDHILSKIENTINDKNNNSINIIILRNPSIILMQKLKIMFDNNEKLSNQFSTINTKKFL
ncbi:MAG: hypothetical protein OEY79_01385 [Anaplasmataceae bacterium]|nr:hypothetical protein [Anaplasmataceae bacterium]